MAKKVKTYNLAQINTLPLGSVVEVEQGGYSLMAERLPKGMWLTYNTDAPDMKDKLPDDRFYRFLMINDKAGYNIFALVANRKIAPQL